MTAIKKAISLVVYQRKPGKETGRKSPSWVLTNFKACRRKLLLKNQKKNEKKNHIGLYIGLWMNLCPKIFLKPIERSAEKYQRLTAGCKT